MKIDRDYFWFQLFKTRGIGAKTLASVAKILAAENLNPEMLPISHSELSAQSPELAKILKDKICTANSERVSEQYEGPQKTKD